MSESLDVLNLGWATPDDVPDLVALLGSLFALEQDFSPEPEKQARGLVALLAEEERARIAVARNATGRVVGMASGQLVISTAQGGYSLWVEDVVIEASARGQGLGPRLLAHLLAWAEARGARRAQLLADRDNLPALGFYRHLGWSKTALEAWRRML